MTKLVWMSDPHFTATDSVAGHDPRKRIDAAISHINTHHGDAELCVITGDMVNHGTRADYEGLRDALGQLSIPVHPLVGNHDKRALFRDVFSLPADGMENFVQYRLAMRDGVALCLDTQKTGSDAGEFCAERMAWLKQELTSAGGTPTYLFLHHPPMDLGLPMQDSDRMENGAAFLEAISGFDCVKYLFIGHVHRPISGVIQGIPFSTMRSVLYQAPAPQPSWDWDSFAPAHEAPNIGIATLENGNVTLHYDQFCQFETGVTQT